MSDVSPGNMWKRRGLWLLPAASIAIIEVVVFIPIAAAGYGEILVPGLAVATLFPAAALVWTRESMPGPLWQGLVACLVGAGLASHIVRGLVTHMDYGFNMWAMNMGLFVPIFLAALILWIGLLLGIRWTVQGALRDEAI